MATLKLAKELQKKLRDNAKEVNGFYFNIIAPTDKTQWDSIKINQYINDNVQIPDEILEKYKSVELWVLCDGDYYQMKLNKEDISKKLKPVKFVSS